MGLIVFVIPISNVVAPPPPAAELPYLFTTTHGTLVSGDIDDLQYFYDDAVVHWKGSLYFPGFWVVEPTLLFNDPGGTYKYVFLAVRFSSIHGSEQDLKIIVFYEDATIDIFWEPSTGGSYVMKSYMLDNYKTVDYICFYNCITYSGGDQQHVYIDCAEVGYSSFKI